MAMVSATYVQAPGVRREPKTDSVRMLCSDRPDRGSSGERTIWRQSIQELSSDA
jgi:hypothetical protein